MKKDITKECKIEIERYDGGFCGFTLFHKENSLLLIKLVEGKDGRTFTKLYDINKGYDIRLDRTGNFIITLDESENRICSKCGHFRPI